MYLVAIAWMYVVLMMGVAEAMSSNGTVLGALLTVLLYGLLPLSVLLYIMGTPMRRRAQLQQEKQDDPQHGADAAADDLLPPTLPADGVPPTPASSTPPDGRSVPPGDAITAKGKEV